MDRLVCGDVGYGKTEVAMRAAFAVAMAGTALGIIGDYLKLQLGPYSKLEGEGSKAPLE